MRLKLLACEILYREICHVVARSPNCVDVEFLPKGLHDIGRRKMQAALSDALDAVSVREYDAVLLGYALCSGGVCGLSPKSVPMVLPRAHDCITLFLGDRKRYNDYFLKHPGTYFKTTGWIERGDSLMQSTTPGQEESLSGGLRFEEMVEKYGRDNAEYLREELLGLKHYRRITFIETGIEPDDRFERTAEEDARERSLSYEKISGDLGLLRRLVDGEWNDEDFLVIPPGYQIVESYDERIVRKVLR
jgi:hypothetical protein